MSQELEQAVREAAREAAKEILHRKHPASDGSMPHISTVERPILKHLSPLFTRLSQRIEEMERIIQDARIGADLNPHGKTLLDFHQVWLDQAKNRIEEMEAELVELREKWERAKGYMQHKHDCIAMLPMGFHCTCGLDALLSSSVPGQAPECPSRPGPAGEPLTEEEKSRMGLVDGTWPADAETKGGKS